MGISEHTKLEIAKQQLFLATDQYLEGKELVAAITLAGAAEEILRSMVKNNNGSRREREVRLAIKSP